MQRRGLKQKEARRRHLFTASAFIGPSSVPGTAVLAASPRLLQSLSDSPTTTHNIFEFSTTGAESSWKNSPAYPAHGRQLAEHDARQSSPIASAGATIPRCCTRNQPPCTRQMVSSRGVSSKIELRPRNTQHWTGASQVSTLQHVAMWRWWCGSKRSPCDDGETTTPAWQAAATARIGYGVLTRPTAGVGLSIGGVNR
jgi:hypothetical protein